MAFGTYGSKTTGSNQYRTVEFAKMIREDIKRAKSLPVKDPMHLPADLKVSVKVPHHGSIRIGIVASPSVVLCNPARVAYDAMSSRSNDDERYLPRYTREGARIVEVLKRIGLQWHWDRSDSMSDYFNCAYYLNVELDWQHRSALELEALKVIDEERKDLEIALAGGQSVVPALMALSQQHAYRTVFDGEMALKAVFEKYDAGESDAGAADRLATLRAEVEEQRRLNVELRAKLEKAGGVTRDEARRFIRTCFAAGLAFHPDTAAAEYVTADGEQIYRCRAAVMFDRRLASAHAALGDEIYTVACEEFSRLNLTSHSPLK
jgi:hypothetical protein